MSIASAADLTPKIAFATLIGAVALLPQAGASGVMRGVVIDGAGLGIPRIEVRAADEESGALLTTQTSESGEFAFRGVPDGRWLLTGRAEGFLVGASGAFGPGQPGVPVRVERGVSVDGLQVTLERPASVRGRVIDGDGVAVPSAVHAMAVTWTGVEESLQRVATATTDPEGQYAIADLVPGRYMLLATPFAGGLDAEGQRSEEGSETAFQASFYPGVTAAAYAATVTLAVAEQAVGLDIRVARVPVAPLVATLTRSGHEPLGYVAAILVPQDVGDVGVQADTSPSARPLRFARVPAGQYGLIGSALEAAPDGTLERLWATRTIALDGETPAELAIDLTAGGRLEGRLVSEGDSVSPGDLPETWLWPVGGGRPEGLLPFSGTLVMGRAGAFTISGIAPGRYVLQFGRDGSSQVSAWSVRHVMLAGQDVADLPIDLRLGDRYQDVEVVLSNHRSELAGTLTDTTGRSRSDVTLVAFPIDSRYWWTGTRRIRLARPDTTGFYVMRGLPEGEYFLAAVSGPLTAEPTDPQWLGGLTAASVRVLLTDGGRTVQDLRMSGSVEPVTPADGDAGTQARPARRWPRP